MPNFPPRARRRFDRRKLPASRPTLTGSRATTPVHAGRVRPHRAAAALRIAFGVVWAIDASLKWLPAFRETFAAMLTAAAQEQPSWLHPWFALWSGLSPGQATLFAYASATTETLLAVALVTGFARKTVYIGAAGYSLLVWATGEGFGGPYHAGATDIGTAIIYSFVFAALLVVAALEGTNPYSLDSYLERRISWWWRIAEFRSATPPSRPVRRDALRVPAFAVVRSESERGRVAPPDSYGKWPA